jgi:antitoxin MazE
VQLVKWGNSLAVRIPKTVLDELQFKEGDELNVRIKNGRLQLLPVAGRETLASLVTRITPENRHGEVDWGGLVGKEVW